ncbi:hypothetical protein Q9L58_009806 [Maublancomyces gigas]|uniref:DUF6532 domain-containing protein n=1 Tax=Discina gigas TaxID=1032678 RepID=A0ABR3G5V2_9PEZI
MAKLSKRKPQGPLAGKRSKTPKLTVPYDEEIDLTDQQDIEQDNGNDDDNDDNDGDNNDDDSDSDDDGDNDDDDSDSDDDDEDSDNDDRDEKELENGVGQTRPRHRGSPAALGRPQPRKILQKHRDMRETQQLHSQLSFISSESTQPTKSGKNSFKRKQQLAASQNTIASQKPLLNRARDSRGSSSYALIEKQLLGTARQETDNHIFFVDAFPDAVELGNLVRESWSSACVEMNITSVLTKRAERNASIVEARRPPGVRQRLTSMQIRQKCTSRRSQYLSHAKDKILVLYGLHLISDEVERANKVKFLLKNDRFNCPENDYKFNRNDKTQRIESTAAFRVDQNLLREPLEARRTMQAASSPSTTPECNGSTITPDHDEHAQLRAKSPPSTQESPPPLNDGPHET